MRDIFYFINGEFELSAVRDDLQLTYKYDYFMNAKQDALEIRIDSEIIQILAIDITTEFGDPEDITIIKNTDMTSCLCISHHSKSLNHVKDILRTLLDKHGGWAGNDSDGFEPRFELNGIDDFEYGY